MTCNLAPTNICIRRGTTVRHPLRPHLDRWRYVQIEDVMQTAPVRIEATGHDIPDQWIGVIQGVNRPADINTVRPLDRLREQDYYRFDVVDADHVEINTLNGATLAAYTSGGHIVIPEPLDLSAYESARMQVNDPETGTQLAYWSTADGTLEIDAAARCIWIKLTPAQSAALAWSEGVYDLELVTAGDDVTNLVSPESVITVVAEQTTDHP